uniref:Uncharacterized protein n=1 Tax=Arundo donax TaxID=35708 RepID=A0A0A9CEF2_ARUDO
MNHHHIRVIKSINSHLVIEKHEQEYPNVPFLFCSNFLKIEAVKSFMLSKRK